MPWQALQVCIMVGAFPVKPGFAKQRLKLLEKNVLGIYFATGFANFCDLIFVSLYDKNLPNVSTHIPSGLFCPYQILKECLLYSISS